MIIKRNKFIIYMIALMMMILFIPMMVSAVEEWEEQRWEQFGSDTYNTKLMRTIPFSSDEGYVKGTSLSLFYGDNLTVGNIRTSMFGQPYPRGCYVSSSTAADLIYANETGLFLFRPSQGDGGFTIEFPDPRSDLSCYDFDGDGRDEIIGMNFQGGEIVTQVFTWNDSTSELSQISTNVMTDYGMTFSGPIICNDFSGSSEWRCLIQGASSESASFSTVVALLKNVGDNQFFFGENESIFANQSSGYGHYRFNKLTNPNNVGTNLYNYYPFWNDRLYALEYDTSSESMTILNFIDYGSAIMGAGALNDFRRGSSNTPNNNKYMYSVYAVERQGDSNRIPAYIYSSSLSIQRNQFNSTTGLDCGTNIGGDFYESTFLYDYDGNGYKDIFAPAFETQGSNQALCYVGFTINSTFDLLSREEIALINSGVTGSIDVQYNTGALPRAQDVIIIDIGNDGDDELVFTTREAGTSAGKYIWDMSIPESDETETADMNVMSSASVFADFTGDGYLDWFNTQTGVIYQHAEGIDIDTLPSVTFNATSEGCGTFDGNPDNFCEVIINSTVVYEIQATDLEGDDLFMSYDCYDEFLPTPDAFIELNSTTKFFNCTYDIIGQTNTNAIVTDDISVWNLFPTTVNITFLDGTQCNNNGICEVGEDETNCLSDCANQTEVCDNDGICESPENIYNCPFDCEPNQCEDGLDNDADNFTDYPDDIGCSSASDDIELNDPQCQDGIDNDGDDDIDFPDDVGCDSLDDDNEFNINITEGLGTFTSTLSWWEQYQNFRQNLGYSHFGTNELDWNGSVTILSKNLASNQNYQALIFDADGSLDNNIMIIDSDTLYFFNATGGTEAEISPADLGLSAFDVDNQPMVHKVDNVLYIMYVDDNSHLIVFTYFDGVVTLQWDLEDILGLSFSGIKCKFNSPECWMIGETNRADEINLEDGTLTRYETESTFLGHTRTTYTEPALDGVRLIWTWYDDTEDWAGVAVFDTDTKTMDLTYSLDGVRLACVGNSGHTDVGLVISHPIVYDVDEQAGNEIITACAVYESVGGVTLARASIDVTKETGNYKWFDILLSTDGDDVVNFNDTESYMNSSSGNRYLVLEQPVVLEQEDGNIIVCTRVQQLAGASFEFNRAEFACYDMGSDVVGNLVYNSLCGNTGGLGACNFTDDIFSGLCSGATCYELNTPVAADLFTGDGDELINYYGVWGTSNGYSHLLYNFTDFSADAHVSVGDTNSDNLLDVVIASDSDFSFLYYTSYGNQLPEFTKLMWNTCSPVCRNHNITYEAEYTDFEGDQIIIRADCVGDGVYTNWSEPAFSPIVVCDYPNGGVYLANVQISDLYNQPLGNVDAVQHEVEVRLSGCFESGQNDGICCSTSLCETIATALSDGFDEFGFNASIGSDITTPDNYQSTNYDFSKCEDWTGFLHYWLWFCPPYHIGMGMIKKIGLWLFSNILIILAVIVLMVLIRIAFKKR